MNIKVYKGGINLRKTPAPVDWWPELEGTVSAETAKRLGIQVPKHLQGKRIHDLK